MPDDGSRPTSPTRASDLAREAGYVVNTPVRLAQKSAALMKSTVLRTVALNRERCKAVLLDTTYQVRHQVLCNFRDLLKSSFTQDPNVPRMVSKYAEISIDMLWKDIEEEIERDIEVALLQQQAREEVAGPSGWWVFSGLLRLRAFLLHHYLPNDKSIWGKVKDPIYLATFGSMLIPSSVCHFSIMSGLLLMLLFPGPPDEFQLLNFIMLFKGLQFGTNGVLKCLKCSMVEYACYSADKNHILDCINTWGPPSTTPLDLMLDYMGTIFLTWLAASMLPRSKVHAHRKQLIRSGNFHRDTHPEDDDEAHKRRAGHRLHILLRYDMVCFLISLLLLTVLTLCLCGRMQPRNLLHDPQFSANIFWCSIFWSLSTFPFLPLNVSWLFVAFSRSTPTGFNHLGACVAFEIVWKEEAKPLAKFFRQVGKAWRTVKGLGGKIQQRRRGSIGEDAEEEHGYARAAADFAYDCYVTAKTKTLEGDTSGGVVTDLVPAPDQVMLIWDRY